MKRILALLCASAMLPQMIVSLSAQAASVEEQITETNGDEMVIATGLITLTSLSVSNSSGQLCINGYTKSDETMKSIGFTDIQVERSSNGTSGWTVVQSPDDVLASDASACYFSNYKVSVTGGYYYRVTCTHYAKESGFWFPETQSITATSNSVYIG